MLNCWVLTEKLRKIKQNIVQNELKLKTFDSGYFIGKSHFEEDGTQNYIVFQPLNKYFKIITNTKYISSWQSKGLSDETIKPPTTSDYILNPQLNYFSTKTRVEFKGSCLKQDKTTFNHGKTVNICIVYELNKLYSKTAPTLVNCLFGAVSMTKNIGIDKYRYSGYGIGFDRIRHLNVEVFNLMSTTNEARHMKWHETCKSNVD